MLDQNDLQEIISKGKSSSPVIDMPQELPINYSSSQATSRSNRYNSYQPTTYDSYPQYTTYPKPLSPQKNDYNGDFHRFYGPVSLKIGPSSLI